MWVRVPPVAKKTKRMLWTRIPQRESTAHGQGNKPVGTMNEEEKKPMMCGECRWYRPEWGECCFGGGWGHYPDPDDDCIRGYVQGCWFNT